MDLRKLQTSCLLFILNYNLLKTALENILWLPFLVDTTTYIKQKQLTTFH